MEEQEIQDLVKKYLNDTATVGERERLSDWYGKKYIQDVEWQAEAGGEEELVKASMFAYIQQQTGKDRPAAIQKLWPRIAVAAAVILCVGVGFYLFNQRSARIAQEIARNNIAPGGNKAYLTLANGTRITLTDAVNGALAEQAGVKIIKTKEGQLVYDLTGASPSGAKDKNVNLYNTITTPRGGQYQVKLPDGTEIWLNAASTLKFPATFAGVNQRKVELNGEAYFEVAKAFKVKNGKLTAARLPFIVKTAKQEVEVLGTHFDINSYADESATKTTLLEGSVRVSPIRSSSTLQDPGLNAVVLKPSQQAINNNQSGENNVINVVPADTEAIVDWKNGEFAFKGEDFKTAMRKIARWYDVEIIYDPSAATDIELGGWVSRKSNISIVLERIESTGNVHFKVEGRRITVMK